jgi:hypothetical protein
MGVMYPGGIKLMNLLSIVLSAVIGVVAGVLVLGRRAARQRAPLERKIYWRS